MRRQRGTREAFPYEETSEDYDFNLHAGRIGYLTAVPGLHYFSREDWNRFIAFLKAKSKLKGRRVAVLWETIGSPRGNSPLDCSPLPS